MSEDVHVIWLSRQPTVAIRFTCAPGEVGAMIGPVLTEIGAYLHEAKVEADAEAVYARFLGGAGPEYEVEAGYTLHEDLPGYGRVRASELPDCEAAIASHTGPYRGMSEATATLREWMDANGREPGGAPWEVYQHDPEATSESPGQRTTEVYWPLKPKR
ncbi:MAG: GyrI-like domain-containing protein [Dehalococcoidia bacterium]